VAGLNDALIPAMLGFVGGLVSALVAFGGVWLTQRNEEWRRRRTREEERSDALRADRARAYARFIEATHETAHLLGRAAGAPPPMKDDERLALRWNLDTKVSPAFLGLVTLASAETLETAGNLRARLRALRNAVFHDGLAYSESSESAYWQVYDPYQRARQLFIEAVRAEILELSPEQRTALDAAGRW
jgi:hypothetical protein